MSSFRSLSDDKAVTVWDCGLMTVNDKLIGLKRSLPKMRPLFRLYELKSAASFVRKKAIKAAALVRMSLICLLLAASSVSAQIHSENKRGGPLSTIQFVNQPFGLNCSLTYLPWSRLAGDLDDASKQSIKPACLAQGGSPLNTVQLLPGMTLRVTDALLFSPALNYFVPGLSNYTWRVPERSLTRADYFFLSILLAAAAPEKPSVPPLDFVKQFRAFMDQTKTANPDTAFTAIGNQILKTLNPELIIGRAGTLAGAPGTATRARQWLTEPAIEDFEGPNYPSNINMREYLRFRIPGATPDSAIALRAFQSGGGFYLDNLKATNIVSAGNAWYSSRPAIYPRRFHFEVQVDISLSRELSSRQVPIYYSFADVERDFHVGIFGFQRRVQFLNCLRDDQNNDIDPSAFASNGVVTVYFGDPTILGAGSAAIGVHWPLASIPALKELLLVAPGDHYFVNPMPVVPGDSQRELQ